MGKITQDAYHRQRMMEYLKGHSVTETAMRYRTSRKTVNKWKNRWDGTPKSLEERTRKPHRMPRKHTEEEIDQIRRVLKKVCWGDLLMAFQILAGKGYQRSYGGFKRIAARLKANKPKRKKAKKPKPYQRSISGAKAATRCKVCPQLLLRGW